MEWLNYFKDVNIARFLADYTIALGIIYAAARVIVSFTKTKKDDQLLEAIAGRLNLIKGKQNPRKPPDQPTS